jgi:methylthioribose-1-phosphate isomerase
VRNPTFDVTPAELVTGGFVTDRDVLSAADIAAVAEDLASLADWM